MAKRYDKLSEKLIEFIQQQKMYFVGTAADSGTVNISPKGYDSLRILSSNRIVWLNVTGSGNETAAHLAQNDRMTMMFCAFEGLPKILRLFGSARSVHPRDTDWDEMAALFEPNTGARQFVDFNFDLVQTSCGYGVPLYDFKEDRDNMQRWVDDKGVKGIEDYWREKNQVSLDGLPTHIFEEDGS